jgi:hypothetical protein
MGYLFVFSSLKKYLNTVIELIIRFFKWFLKGNDKGGSKRVGVAVYALIVTALCLYWCPLWHKDNAPSDNVEMAPVTINGKAASVTITETKLIYVTKAPGSQPVVIGLWPEDKVKISSTGSLSVQRFGTCFKPGIGYGVKYQDFGPSLSIRLLHYRRWGAGVAAMCDRKGTWAVGPVADLRFSFLRNVRVGLGFSLVGSKAPFIPSTVDLR